jgi:acetylornithine deacetylase
MMLVLNELKNIEASLQETKKHELVVSPNFNVGTIHGGTHVDMVPSTCQIEITRTLMPNETDKDASEELDQLIDRLTRTKPMDIRYEPYYYWPGMEISREEQVVVALRQAFMEVMGEEPQIAGKDVPTDAAHVCRRLGIPTMNFSPGDGFLAHTANEHIVIDRLINAVKVVSLFLYEQLKAQSV